MEQWITFAQDKWYVLAIALILLLVVVKIVKTVVKWVIVLAILAGVLYYGADYKDKLMNIQETVATEIKDSALKAVTAEAKEAKYKANPDGSFVVSTKSLSIEGKAGSDEVKITFMNKSFTMKADTIIKPVIEQAKKNAGL